jgi:hypothetical protein
MSTRHATADVERPHVRAQKPAVITNRFTCTVSVQQSMCIKNISYLTCSWGVGQRQGAGGPGRRHVDRQLAPRHLGCGAGVWCLAIGAPAQQPRRPRREAACHSAIGAPAPRV